MTGVSLRRNLLTILQEKIVPAAREDSPLVLLETPVHAPPHERVEVTSQAAPVLPPVRAVRSHIHLHTWPEEYLNSLRVPYLGCIFNGEADIVTGLTAEHVGLRGETVDTERDFPYGRQTMAMKGPGFFLVPPGAPVSYGDRSHWERPNVDAAYSRIFWIHLVPAGAFCHTCLSSRGSHVTHPFIFVSDARLPVFTNLLLTEMMRREQQQTELARLLLLSLLLKLSETLAQEKIELLDTVEAIETAATLPATPVSSQIRVDIPLATVSDIDSTRVPFGAEPQWDGEYSSPDMARGSTILQRALSFIEVNLNQPLNPLRIATYSYVSTSHLNRIFQAELNTSVMDYVTQRRLEKARTILTDTNLPIVEVADLCGYANASHFTQLFTRHEGCSPRAYRTRTQSERVYEIDVLRPR